MELTFVKLLNMISWGVLCVAPIASLRHFYDTGVCEKKSFLLRKPLPCSPAAETALRPLIRCSPSRFPTCLLIRRSVFSQSPIAPWESPFMYGCYYHFNVNLRQSQNIDELSAAHVVTCFASSENLKCRLLTWLLDHPMIAAGMKSHHGVSLGRDALGCV